MVKVKKHASAEYDDEAKKQKAKDEDKVIVPVFGITQATYRPLQNFGDKTWIGVILQRLDKKKLIKDLFLIDKQGLITHHAQANLSGDVLDIEPFNWSRNE